MAQQLRNLSQPTGQLPSNTEKNPSGHRLARRKHEEKYGKFLEVLSKLEINISFIDAIKEMPSYAKFLKEVLSNKRKLPEISVETLRGECNIILECKVPKKEADHESFTIPVKFGEVLVNKALADLGASVSIMPLSLFKRINAKIKPTRMSLQLVDRSVRFLVGVVEDLPVQLGKFYVPCDVVIMDIVEDHVIPIILRKDFLKTAQAVFDVFNGKLTLNILGEDIEFHLPSMMKGPAVESLNIAELARVELMHPQYDDPLWSILEGVRMKGAQRPQV
ncbi:uncharacterized protein LOC130813388 [Amaranthus tricolor]|uniref:uncharacterized protein LOC130813388 n=1 Tax=Amaranthus tricolor TaxID=29722 RepID=UPI0025863899|nr:uncharacterized protein LOC130813388 [Amaranthus tricolor]